MTCDVPDDLARVDVLAGDVEYIGAALHGAGGIMGAGAARAWTDIPKRWHRASRQGELLRIYTKYRSGDAIELVDVAAAETELLAVYAPKYRPTILATRARER